jgi:hypothetical protein
MKHSKFEQLVTEGEKAHVDYKITCEAFASKSRFANAELAKDICAMANNGNIASYIIIGVSDDGTQLRDVKNDKLTDDNVQDFCKKSIYPPPKVRVHRLRWTRVSPEHAGKKFVVIQVGPQARQAFRLNRDFVNYKEGYCFRRNEVWIRRGATSDLATPEEIARLVKGQAPIDTKGDSDYTTTVYNKLPQSDQVKALARDFGELLEEMGGHILRPLAPDLRLANHFLQPPHLSVHCVITIRDVRLVWRSVFVRETYQYGIVGGKRGLANRFWQGEHGVLLFNMGTIRKNHYAEWMVDNVHFKENWGRFTILDSDHLHYTIVPAALYYKVDRGEATLSILSLPNISSTTVLRDSFASLIEFLENDDVAFDYILKSRDSINAYLRKVQDNLQGSSDKESKQALAAINKILNLSGID